MRLINTTDKVFSGVAIVYGEEIHVNSSTCSGVSRIFELMKNYIDKLSYEYKNGFGSLEDAKQEVCLSMLEGILKYNPEHGASLSTFLNIFVPARMIDKVRKMNLRNKTQILTSVEDNVSDFKDPTLRIDLDKRTEHWDERWKNIIFRLFVSGEMISVVAHDEGFTPWGLTRAVRKKLEEARKI